MRLDDLLIRAVRGSRTSGSPLSLRWKKDRRQIDSVQY